MNTDVPEEGREPVGPHPEQLGPGPMFEAVPLRLSPRISRGREAALLAGLVVYAVIAWIWGAGKADITRSMEAMRAIPARGMMRTGDYIVPRLRAKPYLAKPPLFYWAVAIVSRPWGDVTAASVRSVSALCAIGALLVTYFSVRAAFGWSTGFVACVVAAMMPHVFGGATKGLVNMMLSLWVAVSLFGAFYMFEGARGAWAWALMCGAGLGLGLMTKGPIILLFFVPTVMLYVGFLRGGWLAASGRRWLPYLAAAAFLVWLGSALSARGIGPAAGLYALSGGMLLYFAVSGKGPSLWNWRWLIAAGIVVLAVAPWAILLIHRLPFETWWATVKQQGWSARVMQVGVTERPVWYYLANFPVVALPASLFAPLAFFPAYAPSVAGRRRRMLLLARCWVLAGLVLFSVASPGKASRYLQPLFPAAALLAADVMVRGSRGKLRRWMNRYVRFLGAAGVYAACAAPFAMVGAWFASGATSSGWVTVAAVTVAGAALGLYLHRVRRVPWAPLAALLVVSVAASMIVDFGAAERINREESVRPACQRIRSHVPPGRTLYVYGRVQYDMMFYLDGEVLRPRDLDTILRTSPAPLFICLRQDRPTAFELPPGRRRTEVTRVRHEKGTLVLVRID